MANLCFNERDKFERLFEMRSGYVLNLTNREFQSLVMEVMSIDIYISYPNLSKAKILRDIIIRQSNISVGKLLLVLMDYQKENNLIKDIKLFKECVHIGQRLIGKTPIVEKKKEGIKKFTKLNFDNFKKMLLAVSSEDDTPQLRGFAFEKFLYELFNQNNLSPRGSFKINGEQIDGSFVLHNEVYLLEAKWTNKPINKGDLVIFNEKVSSKSGFTRGIFISLSGFTKEATDTLSNGRTINIVLMTVQELFMSFEREIPLTDLIWDKVRALAEEGNYFKIV